VTELEAWEQEVAARRHDLCRRLAELSELAAALAHQLRGFEEPRAWERGLALKAAAVREAAALLRAAEH
jgi:hypothetical protein